jgi:Uncharacterized conserved protein
LNEKFKGLGFSPADILLPKNCDMEKWSVVACDQYTSEPEYWLNAEKFVGTAPSTLHLILPEAELKSDNVQRRVSEINKNMDTYLANDGFDCAADAFILVERTLKNRELRTGLVGAVDLEDYDYNRGAASLIRATEGTVLDRIPPRVRVREGASLELPHVMLLIDDPEGTVIEPLAAKKETLAPVYDFDLMCGSGHVKGYRVDGGALGGIADALTRLARPDAFSQKYGIADRPVLLFAVGDGNHSLATAKECWERVKKTLPAGQTHPARYALVELVNIHDRSLSFEPIHRVAFDVDPEKLIEAFLAFYPSARRGEGEGQRIEYVSAAGRGVLTVEKPESGLAVGTLQNFLDGYLSKNGGTVDYIHGEEVVRSLGAKPGSIGFLLPPMGKSELFKTVITDGVLPRKTFSMGHAYDKRFYLECRSIR